ncbi:hypothetical protein AB0H83_23290 [Dactylosporangium sp. NPDC050688]|uniref:hypothetical protein n=1 Tax=Dactylosporangium sp. NPDC050688 TaxID=3157217 RepID=UPI0033D11AC5
MTPAATRRLVVTAGCAAALLVAAFTVYITTRPSEPMPAAQAQHGTPTPTAAASPSAAGPAWYDVPGLDTVQRLALFAQQLTDADADASTGRHTCRRTQSWSRATTVVHRDDTTICRDDTDGSGLEFGRVLPNRPGLLPLPDGSDRPDFATAPLFVQHYTRGNLQLMVPEPVPTDRVALTDAVLMHHPEDLAEAGPQWLVRQLMNLWMDQYLDRVHRAAALRVLADVQGLTFAGPMTDLAGRAGVAFTLSEPNGVYTIIFNPKTGRVLAFSEVVPKDREIQTIRPGLFGYRLLLELRRQALLPEPSAPPSAGPALA